MTKTLKQHRSLKGVVVSRSGDKTVVVRVDRTRIHDLYQKRYQISKKYAAHDSENAYKKGDEVQIQETRPLSKKKRWKVIKKLNKKES